MVNSLSLLGAIVYEPRQSLVSNKAMCLLPIGIGHALNNIETTCTINNVSNNVVNVIKLHKKQ